MNKRKFLKTIVSIFGVMYFSPSFLNKKNLNKIVNFMEVDKKNDDKKINLILLRKIGLTTKPGQFRLSPGELKRVLKKII